MGYIDYALEKEKDDLTWALWVALYPNMVLGKQKFIEYKEFKELILEKQIRATNKTKTEIIDEMSVIVDKYKSEVKPHGNI